MYFGLTLLDNLSCEVNYYTFRKNNWNANLYKKHTCQSYQIVQYNFAATLAHIRHQYPEKISCHYNNNE
jgi:hypothetical protein